MKTEHTPGPWTVSNNRIHGTVGSGACQGIADMLGNCGVTATVNANAKLIAAAPELLEALSAIYNSADEETQEVWSQARAAIEKATTSKPTSKL